MTPHRRRVRCCFGALSPRAWSAAGSGPHGFTCGHTGQSWQINEVRPIARPRSSGRTAVMRAGPQSGGHGIGHGPAYGVRAAAGRSGGRAA